MFFSEMDSFGSAGLSGLRRAIPGPAPDERVSRERCFFRSLYSPLVEMHLERFDTIRKGVSVMIQPSTTAMEELTKHLTECVTYPATKQAIIEQCNNMEHVPDEGKRLLKDNLPNRVFSSPEDVMHVLPM
jgi:hypothetical protein